MFTGQSGTSHSPYSSPGATANVSLSKKSNSNGSSMATVDDIFTAKNNIYTDYAAILIRTSGSSWP